MPEITEPFATVDDLKARWPDFPPGGETTAGTMLEDASQFIVDVVPNALAAPAATRRRVVCAVVRRAMTSSAAGQVGYSQGTSTVGELSQSWTAANPNGDFYLTKQELKALGGGGRPKAFGVQVASVQDMAVHRPWCDLVFGDPNCSCGASLTLGEPLWEA